MISWDLRTKKNVESIGKPNGKMVIELSSDKPSENDEHMMKMVTSPSNHGDVMEFIICNG